MSRFYFGDSDDSGSEYDGNEASLPFPKPLARSSFLTPTFDPATYLSSLSNRHQTLEDLRVELRDLSQSLNRELLDLVNENYQDFLSLGSTLKGGDEKIEDVMVGLLGFQKDVLAIRGKVDARREEMKACLAEKKRLVEQAEIGRTLLEISERLDELESRLMIGGREASDAGNNEDFEESDTDSDDNEDGRSTEGDAKGSPTLSLKVVQHRVEDYLLVKSLGSHIGALHPFLIEQEERILRIRNTLLLDLSTAVKQAKGAATPDHEKLLKLLRLYDTMNEGTDAIAVLRE